MSRIADICSRYWRNAPCDRSISTIVHSSYLQSYFPMFVFCGSRTHTHTHITLSDGCLRHSRTSCYTSSTPATESRTLVGRIESHSGTALENEWISFAIQRPQRRRLVPHRWSISVYWQWRLWQTRWTAVWLRIILTIKSSNFTRKRTRASPVH